MGERQKGKLSEVLEYFHWESFCHPSPNNVTHPSGKRRGRVETQWEQEEQFCYFPLRDPDYVGVYTILCIS